MKPRRFSLAWFTGADLRALDEAKTDRPFYSALGGFALAISLFNSLVFTFAVAYATGEDHPAQLWYVTIIWLLVMLSLERLVLQMPATSRGWLLASAVPRLLISLVLAASVGEIVPLKLFEPESQQVIAEDNRKLLKEVDDDVRAEYGPQQFQVKQQIAFLTANERKVAGRIEREDLRAQEARNADGPCDERCDYFQSLALNDRRQLAKMRSRNNGRITGLRGMLKRLRIEARERRTELRTNIQNRDGLLARVEALHKLQKRDERINYITWLVRILMFTFDITPLLMKLFRSFSLRRSAYDVATEGFRRAESIPGTTRVEQAITEEDRIKNQGRAARRRNRAKGDYEGFGDDESSTSSAAPIDGYALSEFADRMTEHERRSVTVPQTLRQGALIGMGLCLVTLLGALVFDANGFVLPLLATALVGWVLVQTNFARRAPAWGLKALFATFVGGLVLPFAVLALNL